jgi:EAL domain-containing protein (putative c-di-GMP-specific phosphodiesterase class I)
VRDILMGPDHAAIARAVIVLADSLGCHTYQNYLFSRPLPVAEFEALVKRH